MKTTKIVMVFGCAALIWLVSCGAGEAGFSSIEGAILNVSANDNGLAIDGQTVVLDDMGRFRHTFEQRNPAYVEVNYGKTFYLFLEPGDSLELEIDALKEPGSVKVSGDRAVENAYLIADAAESAEASATFKTNFMDIITLDANNYAAKVDEIWQPFADRFEAFLESRGPLSEAFIRNHRAAMAYSRATILLRYPGWHREATGNREFEPDPGFYGFLDGLELNDPGHLDLQEYRAFLEHYLSYRADQLLKDPSVLSGLNYRPIRAKMRVCLDEFTDPEVRSEMIHSFLPLFVSENNHKGMGDLLEAFRANNRNPEYEREIDGLLAEDRETREGCRIETYKTVGDISLDALVYLPEDVGRGDQGAAVAFFHGGGWDVGKPEWGRMQCEHFSSLGLVAVSFEYRLFTRHDATPMEGLADAKSALRWMRIHADELGLDPDRIAASGFSAGGHLALCAAMLDGYDEAGEDLSISGAPNAFLLWVTPGKVFEGWFNRMLKGKASVAEFDPIRHISPGLPPAVMFQGTEDDTVPAWTAEAFAKEMRAAGNRCDLHMYEGQTHLNWGDNTADVLQKMDSFLRSIGFLDGPILD